VIASLQLHRVSSSKQSSQAHCHNHAELAGVWPQQHTHVIASLRQDNIKPTAAAGHLPAP
jgi:hypothetical protein